MLGTKRNDEDRTRGYLGRGISRPSLTDLLGFGPLVIGTLIWLGLRRPGVYRQLRIVLFIIDSKDTNPEDINCLQLIVSPDIMPQV